MWVEGTVLSSAVPRLSWAERGILASFTTVHYTLEGRLVRALCQGDLRDERYGVGDAGGSNPDLQPHKGHRTPMCLTAPEGREHKILSMLPPCRASSA